MAINVGLTANPFSHLLFVSHVVYTWALSIFFVVSIPRRGHDDEVLDVCFDFTGQYVATASADGKTSHLKWFNNSKSVCWIQDGRQPKMDVAPSWL